MRGCRARPACRSGWPRARAPEKARLRLSAWRAPHGPARKSTISGGAAAARGRSKNASRARAEQCGCWEPLFVSFFNRGDLLAYAALASSARSAAAVGAHRAVLDGEDYRDSCLPGPSFFLSFFFSFCRAPSDRGQPFVDVAVAGDGERFRAGTDERCCGASFVAYAQCRKLSAVRWGKERAAQAMRHLALRDALPVHLHQDLLAGLSKKNHIAVRLASPM